MEILGLVWAASLLNQGSPPSDAVHPLRSSIYQEESQAAVEASLWFDALAQAYGWQPAYSKRIAAFSQYAYTSSWLVPRLSPLASLPPQPAEAQPSFAFMLPGVGHGLTAFDPSLSISVETTGAAEPPKTESASSPVIVDAPGGDSSMLPGMTDWHRWDAIAAVRVVEPVKETDPQSPSPKDTALPQQCWADGDVAYQSRNVSASSRRWQIWVYNHYIGEVRGQAVAEAIADQLRSQIHTEGVDPTTLAPVFGADFAAIGVRNRPILLVDEAMQLHPELPAAAIAVQWVNNLRVALKTEPLSLGDVQMAMAGLQQTSSVFYGTASWYGPGFHGRKTANGERFDQNALTAAHKTLPFGTRLKIRNRLNGKTVVVRINDRGPYIGDRSLDLSRAAAQCLGSETLGVIPYEAIILEPADTPDFDALLAALPD